MQPEISQFLSSMHKAIEQVVLVNLTDPFAQEQAAMVMGTLGFLQLVQDKAFHYELLENHLYKAILVASTRLLRTDAAARREAASLLSAIDVQFSNDPVGDDAHLRPFSFLRVSNERMRELLADLIRFADTWPTSVAQAFDGLLKPFFHDLQLRERAWVRALGFDILGGEAPDLDAILYRDGKLHLPMAG